MGVQIAVLREGLSALLAGVAGPSLLGSCHPRLEGLSAPKVTHKACDNAGVRVGVVQDAGRVEVAAAESASSGVAKNGVSARIAKGRGHSGSV